MARSRVFGLHVSEESLEDERHAGGSQRLAAAYSPDWLTLLFFRFSFLRGIDQETRVQSQNPQSAQS